MKVFVASMPCSFTAPAITSSTSRSASLIKEVPVEVHHQHRDAVGRRRVRDGRFRACIRRVATGSRGRGSAALCSAGITRS